MGKSRRKRRTGGRTTPKANSQSFATTLAGSQNQKHGALGLFLATAEFAQLAQDKAKEPDENQLSFLATGETLVAMLASDPSKLAANVLAVVAEVWPDDSVRVDAVEALSTRTGQLAGLIRTLGNTEVMSCSRVTNEYRDSEVLLFETSLGGRDPLTLYVTTDRYRRSWMALGLVDLPVEEAIKGVECTDQPGRPRMVVELLSASELRREAWMLTANRRIDVTHDAAPIVFGWLSRLLEVDMPFPQIPDFGNEDDDNNDDEVFVDDVLTEFFSGALGRQWRSDPYDELLDHLSDFERGAYSAQWSPRRVEHFLLVTDHDVEHAQVLPALLRAWVRHCAAIRKQRKPLLQAVLAEIDRCEPEFFAQQVADLDVA